MGKVEYLPYAESVELIKNRQLDATLQSSGLGMAAIRDLASTMPITFVAIPADVVAKIDSPAYHAASIPAGTSGRCCCSPVTPRGLPRCCLLYTSDAADEQCMV